MPRPTTRAALSRDRIVAAATGLIDREGLDALSARRLAAELGCEAMSIYHHVGNMGELLNEVTNQALAALPLPDPDSADPRGARRQLGRMAQALLELAGSRPHLFRAIGTRRWRTPAEVAFQLRATEIFARAGLSPRHALRAARTLLVYLNGAGLALAAWALDQSAPVLETASARQVFRGSSAASVARDIDWGVGALLQALLPDAG